MSMSSSSASSLRKLVQHNHSQSTVSSSETDVDSAGYASSSGTTTPEDDTQTFHLTPALQNISTKESMCNPQKKLTVTTKHHNFSSAVKKVKKVAYALAVFKRKRPDDISPILISSPLRERFGKRMSVKSQPDESFYSLPNRRFSLSDVSTPLHHTQTISRKFGTISGSASNFSRESNGMQRSGLRIPSFSNPRHNTLPSSTPARMVPPAQYDALTFRTIMVYILRVFFFVPWCAAVGGALLLFPSYIELVAFRHGYLESPKGIRRFAYWAECGQQHIMIFIACLLAVLWYNLTLGLSLTSIVVSRFLFVWHAFKVERSIPLGDDDQQSLYFIVMDLASKDGLSSGIGSGGTVVRVDGAAGTAA